MLTRAGKKWFFIGLPVVLLFIAFLVFSQLDVGTSMIKEKVLAVVSEKTDAKLEIEKVRGNPVTGYRLEDIRLADAGGKELFRAGKLEASIAFSSLLGGKPSLKQLVLEDARGDVPGLMALLPEQKESVDMESRIRVFLDGGAELRVPVRQIEVRDSTLVTPLGDLKIDEGTLALAGSDVEAEGRFVFHEFPLSGRGKLEWDKEKITLDRLDLNTGSGELKASGALFPSFDVAGELEEIDLGELAHLWPELVERGFAGKFGTTFNVKGSLKEPTIGGRLAFGGGQLSGFTLDDAGSEWFYEGAKRSLQMKDVKASLIGIPVSGVMGFVFSQLPPNLDVDLKATDVSLDRVAERFPALKGSKGTVEEVKVRLTGRTDSIKGNVLVRTGAIETMGQKLGAGKAELVFDGSSQGKFRADSSWLGSPVTGRGTFPLVAGRPVNMVLEAPGVPLEKLAGIRPELVSLKLQGAAGVQLVFAGVPGKDLGLVGVISSDRLRVKGELFQGTRAEVTVRKGDLVIKNFKSVWNKAQLGGSGVVKKLTSGKPELVLDMTVKGLNLESLRTFAPGLATSELTGIISGSASVSGPLASAKTVFTLSSAAVSAAGGVKAEGVEGKGELTLQKQGAIPVSGPFQVSAKKLNAGGVAIGSPSLRGNLASDVFKLDEVTADAGEGSLKASGSISLAEKPMKMDIQGTYGDVNIARMMPLNVLVPVSGKASGTFSARGTSETPVLGGDVSVPRLVVSGMALESLKATFAGTPKDLRIEPFSASVGGAPLTGKASIRSGASMEADFGVQGKGLDLASLTSGLKKAKELAVQGKMDLDVEGTFRKGKVAGKGNISAPSVGGMGLVLTEVNLPFVAEEGKARLEKGSALLYGGQVNIDGEADLARSSWKGSLRVAGTDMQPVTMALMKGKGSLTGKGDFKFDGNGNMKVGSFLGSGSLSVGEGQFGGFKGLDALAKLHGTSTLGYRSILGNYTLDSRALQLLPGTRVLAPQKDRLYRHLEADGPLGLEDKSLDLNVSGNVNVQAFNAFLGGIQGLIGEAGQTPEAMLQGLLGGLTGGLATQDFRDVQFKLQGTTEKPRIKDLKIEQKMVPSQQETPAQGKDIQAAPQEEHPSTPQEILQQKVLEKIFGD